MRGVGGDLPKDRAVGGLVARAVPWVPRVLGKRRDRRAGAAGAVQSAHGEKGLRGLGDCF